MSKLACHCGGVISDVQYPSVTEGEIRTQQDHERFEERIEDVISAFTDAVAAGRREQWITAHFKAGYPLDLPNTNVVADIRARFEVQFMVRVSECQQCGRLYIQRGPDENEWVCFEPRAGRYEGILKGKGAEQRPGADPNPAVPHVTKS